MSPPRLLALDAHHQRHRRAIDIGVEQADARALLCQRHGQVHRHCRFADAAFAGRHRDHMADAGDGGLIQHAAARPHLAMETRSRHALSARGDPLQRSLALILDLILQRAGRRRQLDREAHAIARRSADP